MFPLVQIRGSLLAFNGIILLIICVCIMLGNNIGRDGAQTLAKSLKYNTTLIELYLGRTSES